MAVAAVRWVTSKTTILKHLFPVPNGALYHVSHKSAYSAVPDDSDCNVELALPADDGASMTPPTLPWTFPRNTQNQFLMQVVHITMKQHVATHWQPESEKNEHLEQGATTEYLSKMFFTAKHHRASGGGITDVVKNQSLQDRFLGTQEKYYPVRQKCYPVPFEKMQSGVVTNVTQWNNV